MDIALSNLFIKRDAVSRSRSAENFRGEPGQGGMATAETSLHPGSARAARELGQGWKVSPCMRIPAGATATIMDNDGPGVIRHVWMTPDPKHYRNVIVRICWDREEWPSVECPTGDLLCCSWSLRQKITAIPINVNPSGGMNCFFPMPFRQHARVTIENQGPERHLRPLAARVVRVHHHLPQDAPGAVEARGDGGGRGSGDVQDYG